MQAFVVNCSARSISGRNSPPEDKKPTKPYELLSKLLASPLITLIILSYISLYVIPFMNLVYGSYAGVGGTEMKMGITLLFRV